LNDRASDRERVDLIGLPRLALPAPGGAHPVRRDAHDPLAGCQQRLLEPARDLPAVLDRPHPLLIEPARPFDPSQVSRLVRVDLTSAADLARPLVDRRERMRALVRVRPDHDHYPCPFVCSDHQMKRISGGQTSLGANATLLSGHAEGPWAAAGDKS
jgi:hypothetical protein